MTLETSRFLVIYFMEINGTYPHDGLVDNLGSDVGNHRDIMGDLSPTIHDMESIYFSENRDLTTIDQ